MKKLFFAFITLALVSVGSSCNKCGYCAYSNANGGGNSSATCQNSSALTAIAGSGYKQAKADCEANGDIWVVQ